MEPAQLYPLGWGQAFACFAFRYFFPARLIESEPHIAVHHPPRTPGPLRTQPSDTIEKGGVPPFQQATNRRRARRGVAFATILVLFRPVALRISLSSQRKVLNSFREREIWGGGVSTNRAGRKDNNETSPREKKHMTTMRPKSKTNLLVLLIK